MLASMKKLIAAYILPAVLWVAPAQANEHADGIIDSLLQVGVHALKAEQERRAAEAVPETQQPPAALDAEEPRNRTWRERGREAVSNLLTGTVDGIGDKPLSEVMAATVKGTVDKLIGEYKEQYKQEGREYAKEVGDKIVTQVVNDPKIEKSIFGLQALCWGVIVYLTIVTIIVVFSLLHLKRTNVQLLAALTELKDELKRNS